ncbi:response regulator transcription factor [Actinomadura vinacea]|uniref:Response regulator transcription factor n=2 Tax=Actinomadura vinacea TaxID=115336 RepID=A0ABP5WJ81_9ACTN
MTRILVVDDQQTLAGALEIAIDAQPDMECVGAVGTVEEAVRLAVAENPDVVLMDLHLPDLDGIEGTRRIRRSCPETRVLILTGHATAGNLTAAAGAGAAGFIAKDSAFPDILAAIRAPVSTRILVESLALPVLLEGLRTGAQSRADRAKRAGLTGRELEVLTLMGEGLDPRAIAERLVVSVHTARGHVKNVLMKLDAHSQLEAVLVATRAGLLPDPRTRGERR